MEQTETGYEATVEGTEEYDVEIEIRDGRIYDMYCSCPYAEDGNYCKHMAAVLYVITEESDDFAPAENVPEKQEQDRAELEKTIEDMPEAEIRGLVLELALEDESLRNRILAKYAEGISELQMIRLKKEVDGIVYRYSDRSGFVDYYHAMDFTNALNEFLDDKVQILIEQCYHKQAFELTNHVFYCVGNQDMDDSDGGISWIADHCYEIWQQILSVCSEKEKRQMFQWFQSHRENYAIDYLEDYIDDFLMNEFHDPDLLKQKLEMLDEQIEKAGSDTDSGRWYSEYRQKFRHFLAIRKLELQEYMDKNDYKKAVELLQESKKLDKSYPGLIEEYSSRLIEIYRKTGQDDAYKQELEYQIFQCFQSDLRYVLLLKNICNSEEWLSYREKILKAKTAGQIHFDLLLQEGLYQQLLDDIQKSGYISTLDKYEKALKKHFPVEVRDIYISFVNKEAVNVSDRKHYRELMRYLKKISAYPDGKKKVQEIAADWRVRYKRRSAMMDELENVVK